MKASVILPCYNAVNTISVQLQALAKQEFSEAWEIIVADNGSTDGTVEFVKQFQTQIPNLRLINAGDRQGAGHARNMAANVAQGEFLLFCDADDEVATGWLAAMAKALEIHDFVAGPLDYTKLNEPWLVRCYEEIEGDGVIEHPYLPFAGTNNLGIKHSLHQAMGGFDEALVKLQDVDYSWRMQEAGIQLHEVPEAIVHFRFRPNFREIYRRAIKMGCYEVLLENKHRPMGMPEMIKFTRKVKGVLILSRDLVLRVRDRESFGKWLWSFAWCLGNLQGCVKYRYGMVSIPQLTDHSLKV